ncbi:Hypp9451 [Branchiostoma lanceolatum]|uniref:Hypp9451 protein n=1 Tax=Branchiostoma lanceolatum TaxID=7740 RepID=A0A8S4MM61_BRALA|nr:Hypp9451 [Branchiostoma lanceolatum]
METSLDRNCEIVWAKFKLRGKRGLLIGSYYRPHEGLEDSLKEMAESLRLACQSSNAIVVLGGDFNLPDLDWKERTLKPGSSYPNIHRQFVDIISDLGMEQIVEKPTRGTNTLDIIVTNHPSLFPRVEIIPGLSDHDIPYAELQITNARLRQKERHVLYFKKADWEGLRKATKDLTNSILSTHTDKPDVEAVWADLKTGLRKKSSEVHPP